MKKEWKGRGVIKSGADKKVFSVNGSVDRIYYFKSNYVLLSHWCEYFYKSVGVGIYSGLLGVIYPY